MNYFTAFLICIMTISPDIKADDERLAGLESLRWEHRLILVFAREPLASQATSHLTDRAAEIEDRDIAWFVLSNDSIRTNLGDKLDESLREQILKIYFTPRPEDTAVHLIGKDGGVKHSSSDLDLDALFGLIDRMPMRRQEMRRAD